MSIVTVVLLETGAGWLTGTLTATLALGIATFSGLQIDLVGTDKVLRFTGHASSFTLDSSPAFAITVGAAAKLAAARKLGCPVILVNRPALPHRPTVGSVQQAMQWLGATVVHEAERGV